MASRRPGELLAQLVLDGAGGKSYCRVMGWPAIGGTLRWAALSAVVLAVAACSNSPGPAAHPATPHATPASVTDRLAGHRFTVTLGAQALKKATADGTSLPQVIAHALARINALLPGPPTTITVSYASSGSQVIPQTGTNGYTDPGTGDITLAFAQTPQASLSTIMQLWLPRTFSHEIDHSVRILAGPGFGASLLEEIITEGISSAFDLAAFPGTPSPWDRAITRSQECALWKQAQPLLGSPGLYDQWMFGGGGIPHWTGFTIGYDIVTGYRQRHPDTSWPAITAASAATILAGSHYQPCSS
jgi:hypothetical protein